MAQPLSSLALIALLGPVAGPGGERSARDPVGLPTAVPFPEARAHEGPRPAVPAPDPAQPEPTPARPAPSSKPQKTSPRHRTIERPCLSAAHACTRTSIRDARRVGGAVDHPVARRVVGQPMVGGPWFRVHGLSDEYQYTMVDGARVRASTPSHRTLPLDSLPSGTVDAVTVDTASMPYSVADFAGTAVHYHTARSPSRWSLDVGLDAGFNTASLGESYRGDRFSGDGFAVGNRGRALPSDFETSAPIRPDAVDDNLDAVWTPDDIEQFGEAMPSTNTAIETRRGLPNMGLHVATGSTFDAKGTDVGFVAGAGYSVFRQQRDVTIREFDFGSGDAVDPNAPQAQRTLHETRQTAQWSGLAKLEVRPSSDHALRIIGLYSRAADDIAGRTDGVDARRTTHLGYEMDAVALVSLGATHRIRRARNLAINWMGAYTQARRDEPLAREATFDEQPDGSLQLDAARGPQFRFADETFHSAQVSLDFSVPLATWHGREASISFGGWFEAQRLREDVRRFRYDVVPGLEDQIPSGDGNVLGPESIGGGPGAAGAQPFYLQELTLDEDGFRGGNDTGAGWVLADLPVLPWLRLLGGVRYTFHHVGMGPRDPFGQIDADMHALVDQGQGDLLPSGGFVFSPRRDMNVRVLTAATVMRPQVRWRTLRPGVGAARDADTVGNPDLVRAKVWNVDLRWEWFPGAHGVIAAGPFYKHFEDPLVPVLSADATRIRTVGNGGVGHAAGVEVELRHDLGFIAAAARPFSIGAQASYAYSLHDAGSASNAAEVHLRVVGRSQMPGVSQFVVRSFVGYDGQRTGTHVRISYNVLGPELLALGAQSLPDELRATLHNLGVGFAQKLYRGLFVSLDALNLVNTRYVEFHDGFPDARTVEHRQGATFMVQIGYRHPSKATNPR